LGVASALFRAAFERAGSSLSLLAERRTYRRVPGIIAAILRQSEVSASCFRFQRPMFVILFAPVFAWQWAAMRKREPSSPAKFTFGLVFIGLVFGGTAFAVTVPAALLSAHGAHSRKLKSSA
jgi:POT family proton-dependent oligopeptide transporter